jgi:hypothetical protein
MSQRRQTHLIDWGFRLLIVAMTILWLVFPPRGAEAVGRTDSAVLSQP